MSRLLSCVLVFVAVWGSLQCLPVGDKEEIWERSGKFEGDIVFRDGVDARNGILDPIHYWPNRTLVYKIAPNTFDSDQKAAILSAFAEYETHTCIKIRQAVNDEKDYVYITGEDTGCHSHVGFSGGKQSLNLHVNKPGHGCLRHGTIMHETLHALGFYHQQSATDRDDYVNIIWENIETGHEHNFNKYPADVITDFGVTYDYGSIMHYGPDSFSVNGKDTIVPIDPNAVIGQRDGFSDKDIEKLEIMYGCRTQ